MDQVDLSYDLNENIPNMGCHLILDFHQVTSIDMNDYNLMHEFLTDVIIKSGGTIEGHQFKQFEPQGLTILYLLSESHFSIHTWPEYGACAIDFYHCGETASKRLKKAEELLCDKLGWNNCTSSILLDRGLRRKHQLNSYNNQTTIFSNLKLLEREKSAYQDIRVYTSKYYGNILSLNNMIQIVSNQQTNEFNKILVDPVIENIQNDLNNKKLLLLGGGDLSLAAYILQEYSELKELVVVEIDEKVHDFSKKYILNEQELNLVNRGLEEKKLKIIFQDGIQLVKDLTQNQQEKYDGLFIDCADMLQQFEFTSQFLSFEFYEMIKKILNPGCYFSHMLSNDTFKKPFKQLLEQAQFRQIFFKTAFQPEFSMPVPIGYAQVPQFD